MCELLANVSHCYQHCDTTKNSTELHHSPSMKLNVCTGRITYLTDGYYSNGYVYRYDKVRRTLSLIILDTRPAGTPTYSCFNPITSTLLLVVSSVVETILIYFCGIWLASEYLHSERRDNSCVFTISILLICAVTI